MKSYLNECCLSQDGITSVFRVRFSLVMGIKKPWTENIFVLQNILNARVLQLPSLLARTLSSISEFKAGQGKI